MVAKHQSASSWLKATLQAPCPVRSPLAGSLSTSHNLSCNYQHPPSRTGLITDKVQTILSVPRIKSIAMTQPWFFVPHRALPLSQSVPHTATSLGSFWLPSPVRVSPVFMEKAVYVLSPIPFNWLSEGHLL